MSNTKAHEVLAGLNDPLEGEPASKRAESESRYLDIPIEMRNSTQIDQICTRINQDPNPACYLSGISRFTVSTRAGRRSNLRGSSISTLGITPKHLFRLSRVLVL